MKEEIVGLVKRSRWRADPDPSDKQIGGAVPKNIGARAANV